jgi:hypothetical protein
VPTNNVDNAKKFGEALARFAKAETPQRARLLHRRLTLEALTRIVRRTAVDTGRARGNWQTSVGAPRTESVIATSKAIAPVVAEGAAALRDLEPFGVTFISNNLVYIERLENGHSKQAPEGMVSVTLAELAAGLNLAADEQLGGPAP